MLFTLGNNMTDDGKYELSEDCLLTQASELLDGYSISLKDLSFNSMAIPKDFTDTFDNSDELAKKILPIFTKAFQRLIEISKEHMHNLEDLNDEAEQLKHLEMVRTFISDGIHPDSPDITGSGASKLENSSIAINMFSEALATSLKIIFEDSDFSLKTDFKKLDGVNIPKVLRKSNLFDEIINSVGQFESRAKLKSSGPDLLYEIIQEDPSAFSSDDMINLLKLIHIVSTEVGYLIHDVFPESLKESLGNIGTNTITRLTALITAIKLRERQKES